MSVETSLIVVVAFAFGAACGFGVAVTLAMDRIREAYETAAYQHAPAMPDVHVTHELIMDAAARYGYLIFSPDEAATSSHH